MVVLQPEGTGTGELRVSLLGEFQIFERDRPVRLRGRKARALLAFLATHPNRSVGRDLAADLLWSDRGAEQARKAIGQSGFPVVHRIVSAQARRAFLPLAV